MQWWEAAAIGLAGLWAGTINTVVGSGTLVTFPALLALGYPPITATTSNAVGLAPGAVAGAIGYRGELAGQRGRVLRYAVASAVGAVCGTVLLLSLPPDAFEAVVPVLVLLAIALVAAQPLLSRWLPRRPTVAPSRRRKALIVALVLLIGVYGGYFTAAQGIMTVGAIGLLVSEPLQALNAIKNVCASVVNVVAGAIYAVVAPVDWAVIGILMVASTLGGVLGAAIGRRLRPAVLRAVIVAVGLVAVPILVLR